MPDGRFFKPFSTKSALPPAAQDRAEMACWNLVDSLSRSSNGLTRIAEEKKDEIPMSDSVNLPRDIADELKRLRRQVARLKRAQGMKDHLSARDGQALERYRQLFDSAPVAIWEEDFLDLKIALDGLRIQGVQDLKKYLDEHPDFVRSAAKMIKVTDVNDEAVRLYRAGTKENLLNSEIRVLMPESEEAFTDELVAIADGKHRFKTEAVTRTFDGTAVEVLVEMRIPTQMERFRHMLLTIVDISDRVSAFRALAQSEERLRAVFTAAQDCIYIKDDRFRFTHVNPAMEKLLGRAADQIQGMTAEGVYGPVAGKHIEEVDRRVLSGQCIEEEHTRPVNGVPVTFHDIRVPLRDTAGAIVGLCGISRNITEIRRARQTHAPVKIDYPSEAIRTVLEETRRAAQTDAIILLLGESGSGKDHLARWIHNHSRRASGPFFTLNCAAIPGDLAESELFGHEAGAFTGAKTRRRGFLELAEGGTLLLNEIGELSLPLQSKLLSFLDTRCFMRVGGEKSVSINARIIAATHRNLDMEVANDRFLKPLFYRLNVFSITAPPLRERRQDVPFLVRELLPQLCSDMNMTHVPRVNAETMAELEAYDWPGNVRELRNVLERALMTSDGMDLKVLLPAPAERSEKWSFKVSAAEGWDLKQITDRLAHSLCTEVLRQAKGNRIQASRMLGISRTALYRLMMRFDMLGDLETDSKDNARS